LLRLPLERPPLSWVVSTIHILSIFSFFTNHFFVNKREIGVAGSGVLCFIRMEFM
jgi:uncharacterized membrane protein YoaT (DUF817 family)